MFADDASDNGSTSELISSIFSAGAQLGSAALLSSNQPNLGVAYPQPINSNGFLPNTYGQSSGIMSFLIIAIVVVVGFFAFKKLA